MVQGVNETFVVPQAKVAGAVSQTTTLATETLSLTTAMRAKLLPQVNLTSLMRHVERVNVTTAAGGRTFNQTVMLEAMANMNKTALAMHIARFDETAVRMMDLNEAMPDML